MTKALLAGAACLALSMLATRLATRARENRASLQQRLQSLGTPAEGRVVALHSATAFDDEAPELTLTIERGPEGSPALIAKVTLAVPEDLLSFVQPGQNVPIRFDHRDPSVVTLDLLAMRASRRS